MLYGKLPDNDTQDVSREGVVHADIRAAYWHVAPRPISLLIPRSLTNHYRNH
jgi:hypothetical protein